MSEESHRSLKRWIFPVARLRQLANELDPSRVLVRREPALHEGLELRHRAPAHASGRVLRTTKALGLTSPSRPRVRRPPPRARHRERERRLHLEGRHPDAAHLEHVVGAAAVRVVAVGVARVAVARARPRAVERGEALARGCSSSATHADGPRDPERRPPRPSATGSPSSPTSFSVVARHRLARRAVAHVARAVREEDVQHLRRADAVEDVGAEALPPPLADVLGQRLARRDADAQRGLEPGAGRPRRRRASRRRASARRRRSSAGALQRAHRPRPGVGRSAISTAVAPTCERKGHARCRGRRRRRASPPRRRRRPRGCPSTPRA